MEWKVRSGDLLYPFRVCHIYIRMYVTICFYVWDIECWLQPRSPASFSFSLSFFLEERVPSYQIFLFCECITHSVTSPSRSHRRQHSTSHIQSYRQFSRARRRLAGSVFLFLSTSREFSACFLFFFFFFVSSRKNNKEGKKSR